MIQILLRLVSGDPIGSKSLLVQVIARHQSGDNPLPKPMMTRFNDAYQHHWDSMS